MTRAGRSDCQLSPGVEVREGENVRDDDSTLTASPSEEDLSRRDTFSSGNLLDRLVDGSARRSGDGNERGISFGDDFVLGVVLEELESLGVNVGMKQNLQLSWSVSKMSGNATREFGREQRYGTYLIDDGHVTTHESDLLEVGNFKV